VKGAVLGLILLPAFVYYFWICLEFYNGQLQYPTSVDDIVPFFRDRFWGHIRDSAAPTWKATAIYLTWFFWQFFLAVVGPGPSGHGVLLKDGKSRIKYKFNGIFAWIMTLIAVSSLHYFGIFRLSELYDNFGPLYTVATLWATAISFACYFGAKIYNVEERMSGIFVYDFFMGAVLNPSVFGFDFKFFAEIRPGIMLWFFLTCSMAVKQYDQVGYVCAPLLCMCFYHLCYANACYKGEECIPMSMDIIYEKFGWMLCWANLVWVPFTYCFPAYYLLKIGPVDFGVPWVASCLLLHIAGYYIFDTSNSQKDYFREARPQRGFPRLPYGQLKNPKFIPTERGTKLLISGWWGVARHMNYTGDLMMAWAWGLTCGFKSFIPFFYATYMTILLIHRDRRDDHDCRRKYGKDWDKYLKAVPYRLIPYLY